MNLYAAMGHLLDYPAPDIPESIAQACMSATGELQSLLLAFSRSVEQMGISRLQEIYIETFEFRADTSPYIGHHLFGEEIRRNLFMAELRGRYRDRGLADNIEMPDHLSQVLGFIGTGGADEERTELIHVCLVPALQKMVKALKPDNPYMPLLQAILLACRQEFTSIHEDGEIAWTPFYS